MDQSDVVTTVFTPLSANMKLLATCTTSSPSLHATARQAPMPTVEHALQQKVNALTQRVRSQQDLIDSLQEQLQAQQQSDASSGEEAEEEDEVALVLLLSGCIVACRATRTERACGRAVAFRSLDPYIFKS